MTDNCLPSGCILRRATVEDIWTIRRLVLSAQLDFTQLRWQQFWLIEQERKAIAGRTKLFYILPDRAIAIFRKIGTDMITRDRFFL